MSNSVNRKWPIVKKQGDGVKYERYRWQSNVNGKGFL